MGGCHAPGHPCRRNEASRFSGGSGLSSSTPNIHGDSVANYRVEEQPVTQRGVLTRHRTDHLLCYDASHNRAHRTLLCPSLLYHRPDTQKCLAFGGGGV
jgi:hypothetical protein